MAARDRQLEAAQRRHIGVQGQVVVAHGSQNAAAWFMPAHQEVGMDHVSLHPPESLRLDDATSQQLMQALAPLAAEDGISLHWVSAHRWLAVGEVVLSVWVFTACTLHIRWRLKRGTA